jgi:Protein of unknown function (DUF2808)
MFKKLPKKSSLLRLFSALAIAAASTTGLAAVVNAQSGLTLFSGVDRDHQLNYKLDYDGRLGQRDNYHLKIPAQKLEVAVSKLVISYPDSYHGTFNTNSVQVEAAGKKIELDEVTWDRDNRAIEIYPKEPIPAATRLEIVLSRVSNPTRVGTHYFNISVQSPGDLPLTRYIGTCIINIGGNN